MRRNPDAPADLYNLREVLCEERNTAARYVDIVARVEEIFIEACTDLEHWPVPAR